MSRVQRCLFCGSLVMLVLAGCGQKSPVIPVRGTVTFEGRDPPEVCRITFLPLESDENTKIRPNGATVTEDGVYKMTPHLGVEGLLPGTYAVRVAYYDLKQGGNPDREGDWIERTYDAEQLVVPPGGSSVDYDIVVTGRR